MSSRVKGESPITEIARSRPSRADVAERQTGHQVPAFLGEQAELVDTAKSTPRCVTRSRSIGAQESDACRSGIRSCEASGRR